MPCVEYNAFWQEHMAAVRDYVAAIHALVGLVDHSAEDPAFNHAHLQIKAARARCDLTQAALALHQAEHGCSSSN